MKITKMKPEIKKALQKAFGACDVMALYDGDVETWLKVIAQVLVERKEKITTVPINLKKSISLND